MLLNAAQPEMIQVWEKQTSNKPTHQGYISNNEKTYDSVLSITSEMFQREILESGQPVILAVYASWCGACQKSAPVFAELSREYSGAIKFAQFNVSSEEKLVRQLGIKMIPTYLFYKNGQIVDRSVGLINRSDFILKIANAFRK
jgi:thioredoxin 1